MSVIRQKPFIESVIESLTDEQKASLLSVMNGSENTVNASFTDLPENDVAPVLFQLEPNNLKTGILIQGDTYNVLLAYHRFQDMQIYNLDLSKFTFEKINEYLDINELRRVVSGGSVNPSDVIEIVNDAIENGDITAGTEVVANPTLAGTESPLTGLQVGDTKYKVSGGNAFDYLDIMFNDKNNNTCKMRMIGLYKEYFERQESVALFNGLITQLNSLFSTNIPAFTQFEDLYEITSYIYGLDNITYKQLKDIFYINLFSGLTFFTFSIQVYRTTGISESASIYAIFDEEGVDTIFIIKVLDASSGSTTDEIVNYSNSDTLNFLIWVNKLD